MTINVFGGGNTGGPAFPVQRSVRLRSSASAYFNRTLTTPTNNLKWTWSAWVKRGILGATNQLFSTGTLLTGADQAGIQFFSDNTFIVYQTQTGTGTYEFLKTTSQVFRDASSWYHIVVAYDSTDATAGNRLKIYINGVQVTSFASSTDPSLNLASRINAARVHDIGRYGGNLSYTDGYITEINFIDGQALTPSSFGSINSTTGVWQPIKYSGTYGTNGFYLNFNDNSAATAAAIGKDSSGNGNNWTPNNISVTAGVTYDSMLDVPTLTSANNANFAVMNPLNTYTASVLSVSNGNLTVSAGTNSVATQSHSNIGITSGKWYWEVTPTAVAVQHYIGVCKELPTVNGNPSNYVYWAFNGGIVNNAGTILNATNWAANDVLGWALDLDNDTLALYKNNTLIYTVTSLRSAMGGIATSDAVVSFNWTGGSSNSITCHWNFGQRPFTYTPPSGFKSLNTYNLPAPTIPNGKKHFDVSLRNGFGSSGGTISSLQFQPDMLWSKTRNVVAAHNLNDSVRGVSKVINPNLTDAEVTTANYILSFNSNGYTIGTTDYAGTTTAADWCWKASNAAPVTNTSGSITSSVSANPSAGFSVVTYTCPSAVGSFTVGHGLGVAPSMIIVKDRSANVAWVCYHKAISTTTALYLVLNSTAATASAAGIWGAALPTSTVFGQTQGVGILANDAIVAYCWAEIPGFSKFGSYTGNGSTDGPFVYCGFKPRWIMIKGASYGTTGWAIYDTSRNTYNVANNLLLAESSGAESNYPEIDILSNGFKVRGTNPTWNNSGGTLIFAAFSESPFNYSPAR